MFPSRHGVKGWRGVSVALSVFVATVLSCVVAYFAMPMEGVVARTGHDHGAEDGRFQVSTVFGDLVVPTAVEFADDGRVFVAEKSGIIKVFDGLDDTEPTIFADLTANVHSYSDRGLIGFVLHPNFPEDPRVYVSYTYDAPIGGTAPVWNDCADTEDQINNDCIVSGNLSILTANADKADGLSMVGGEEVLINDWCQKFPSHSVGDIEFGADGALYMSGGEGAGFNGVDHGQSDDGVCGDPEDEGGALRSQDLRTEGDPVGLAGTLIRVDPDTGGALPDNPRFTAPDDNESRIIAYGFRNPFRLAMSPGANDVWVGNVGWHRWEEINHVPESRKDGSEFGEVPNHGWPCYEGAFREPGYEAASIPICEELHEESPKAVVDPHIAWRHCDPVFGIQPCDVTDVSSSTSGVEFYEGDAYPEEYRGALFFADGPRGKVWMSPEGSNGLPDPDNIHTILDDSKGYVVDLENGPGGEMHMVHVYGEGFGPGRIAKITQGPVARIEADETFGASPLTVNFDASASSDPSGGGLSYVWDLDGDGDFDDSTEPSPSFTYTGSENHVVRVKVANIAGQEAMESVTIYPDNTPPTANIHFVGVYERDGDGNIVGARSAEGWRVGDEIGFNGFGLDEEDDLVETPHGTTLPTDSVRWDVSLVQCAAANECERELVRSFANSGGGGIITAPDTEYPARLEFKMTVTDSEGLEGEAVANRNPRTVNLAFESEPAGVNLTVGGRSEEAPFVREAIVGSTNAVEAPETADVSGVPHRFESWSNGEGRGHEIVAPEEDARYTASYESAGPPETTIDSKAPDPTNSRSARFTFSSSLTPATFECSLDGAEFSACSSPKEYEELGDGEHTFAVRAVDGAGMKDPTPAEHSWVVDATPPETAIDSGPSGFTNDASATLAFSSEEGATFECSLDGALFASCASPQKYTGLSDGVHIFKVRAKDRAGNVDGSPAERSWTLDRIAPDTPITSGPSGTVRSSSATFSFTSSEGGSTFECRLDGGQFQACESPHTLENLSRGKHTFAVRAKDRAGNVDASPATRSWTVNVAAPRITALSPSNGAQTKARAPVVRAAVRHPEGSIPKRNVKTFMNGNPRAFTYNRSSGLATPGRANLPRRLNVVKVVATDEAGNTTTYVWRFRTIR
ncbi:MAG: PQQ-dependent sugar dehydrogenase [Rubrobacter sp.]|nr:PQQ-dependent sugar dehydrogenase [Rubrobacter sp.]